MTMHFIPGITPTRSIAKPLWFAFRGNEMLIIPSNDSVSIPSEEPAALNLHPLRAQYFGAFNGRPCYTADLPDNADAPEGMAFRGLLLLYPLLSENLFWVSGRAFQIVHFDRTHRFCSLCGTPLTQKSDEMAKICPGCNLVTYPRISPAIIVMVIREQEILLARAQHFPDNFYSVLAGFVEPGETLEEAVRREIKEEVDISVKNIRYFGSLPWPFPHSLMIAFIADYAEGAIRIDGREIVDASWFCTDTLPRIPGRISIARRMIDWFIEKQSECERGGYIL